MPPYVADSGAFSGFCALEHHRRGVWVRTKTGNGPKLVTPKNKNRTLLFFYKHRCDGTFKLYKLMNHDAVQLCNSATGAIDALRFQLSNRLFLMPFEVTQALHQLHQGFLHQESERLRLFWVRETSHVNGEIDLLNELVVQAGGLHGIIQLKSGPHVLDALDALTLTAMSFKLLQVLDNCRQNKMCRIDAYRAEKIGAERLYVETRNLVRQQFVDEEVLLTTVLKNT